MIKTIISKPALLVDLPEVTGLTSKFVYNYFTPDERVNESPDSNGSETFLSTNVSLSATENINYSVNTTNLTDDVKAFYGRNAIFPRYVKIQFKSPTIEKSNEFSQLLSRRFERGLIARESAPNVFGRTGVAIVDTLLDKTIYSLLSGSAIPTAETANEFDNTTARLIAAITDSIQPDGYRFASTDARAQASSNVEDVLQGIEFGFSIDTRIAADIANGSLNSTKNVYVDELSKTVQSSGDEDLDNLQRQAIATTDPYIIRTSDFEENLPSLSDADAGLFSNTSRDNNSARRLKNFLIGYIVQKLSIRPDGTQNVIEEKVITSPSATTFLDASVAYGRRYRYNVVSVYACQFELDQQVKTGRGVFEDRRVVRTAFFTSKGMSTSVICEEVIAPPPPVDLKFRYRGDNLGLAVTWNFPVNLQRDIKKFQVFRRASTSEPFQLIKMYDFDDSVIRSSDPESIPQRLISRSILPTTIHYDTEFTKNSRFIYAICAIDAHGYTSNYSVQLEASYDRYRNKINTRVISRSDAPKPYPNIFLNRDTFVDTMKMSGYTRLNVYFNPDLITVFNTNGNDVEHIKYYDPDKGEDNTYKLMIVNTDFQQSQVLDIKINNSYAKPPIITPSSAKVFSPT
jgi:hypothetical protein